MVTLIITTFILIISLIGYMYFLAHQDHLLYHAFSIDYPLNNQVKIFFISDIHTRLVDEKTLHLVSDSIDYVVIGGDLAEKGVSFTRIRENLKRLKQFDAPLLFVWGNNDYELPYEAYKNVLEKEGVLILKNEIAHIKTKTKDSLCFVGVDDEVSSTADMDSLLNQVEEPGAILLTHRPNVFYDLSVEQKSKLGIALSGHTHGGQIRIFGLGLYQRGGVGLYANTPLLVSEGYGFTSLPLRLGTKSQCHVVVLNSRSTFSA